MRWRGNRRTSRTGVVCFYRMEGLTVLVLRAHYTMDVLTAAVAAFVAAALAASLCVGF